MVVAKNPFTLASRVPANIISLVKINIFEAMTIRDILVYGSVNWSTYSYFWFVCCFQCCVLLCGNYTF